MTTFYFTASVVNANVNHVAGHGSGKTRIEALADFVQTLTLRELDATHVQNVSFDQYMAARITDVHQAKRMVDPVMLSPSMPV